MKLGFYGVASIFLEWTYFEVSLIYSSYMGTFIIACGGDESFSLCIIIILILNCLAIYSSSVIHWNIIK